MIEKFSMDMNEFLPLREVVYNTLRKAILKGEFQPGERLMEITLANRLGVSRTPVREAMRQLENEGLVLMIPRKGAQVAKITRQEMTDVLEVRKSLEILAVEKACERISASQKEELKVREEEFKKVLLSDDITAIAEADEAFHEVIYRATGNRRLIQLLSNLREQMYRFRVEYLKNKDSWELLIDEHRRIVEALVTDDRATARDLTAQHIDNQQSAIDKLLEENDSNDALI
ncbi:MAG: GntR family transcriptional regulator [Lachnospiraceae bacterium]|nr:GntR family transcriptional regulator [Lachnospiraceae bacterium]